MKVELENVKPMEIEKRSFEIITSGSEAGNDYRICILAWKCGISVLVCNLDGNLEGNSISDDLYSGCTAGNFRGCV